ncbi:hypothetical protein PQO03_10550 [Lentisphaera profundi]|uniref:Uncharacterized protein n=1 Tax=Lentisphaera profundi TaxID=1658616 RepID=A0ABY7VPR2_9BACT|nr:hypothetical protein [Lentisphaera profundi]WDE96153.1 hypothetical protein PQO03_10550 [Lentisphaera profundi]
MTKHFHLALLFFSFLTSSTFALEIIINAEKSAEINQAIFLQLTKFPNQLFVENPAIIIEKTLDDVLANSPGIVISDKTALITDIATEANKQARAYTLKLHPKLDVKQLNKDAVETFPIYNEGDYVEFTYDPFRKVAVKGKIKRITREFLFVGFSGQYAIKNILDPALRDSFFPDKVKTNRQKYIDTLIAKQRYSFNITLNKNVQPIADKLIAQNEKNGFVYINHTWHLISDLITSRVNDKAQLLTKKQNIENEKLQAEANAIQAEANRLNDAKNAEAQKIAQARLDKKNEEIENAKRIAELQGDAFSEEDKLKEQELMLQKLAEEEEAAAKIAAAKRAAKAALKKPTSSDDSSGEGSLAGFQIFAIGAIVFLGLLVVVYILFKDKINGKFKRNKVTLDQITGVSAPAPSTKMPGEETHIDRPSPSLSQQAEASRGDGDSDGDGAKIQKKSISFSKNKPGNASNFFSPEEIDKPETLSTDTTQTARSQTISTSNARPGNSSKAPLTPPGGGLTPPGGGLAPPSGGLTPPVQQNSNAEEPPSSLITDPNLKPKPKLQLKK